MFDLRAWWRARRKPLPPGDLVDLITKLDAKKTPLNRRAATLRQYALSQVGRDRTDGKGK